MPPTLINNRSGTRPSPNLLSPQATFAHVKFGRFENFGDHIWSLMWL